MRMDMAIDVSPEAPDKAKGIAMQECFAVVLLQPSISLCGTACVDPIVVKVLLHITP
jgi:hypothetical protein